VSVTSVAGEISISAIMPVYNGSAYIGRSLPPLAAMLKRGEIDELIVVNDGSTDDSVAIAESVGATIHHTGGRMGVGHARNLAANVAAGNILWYVDADVIIHDDVALKIRDAFADESLTAVMGSYDDQPPAQNFLSQYKNLLNHYFHHGASREATTFWGACGAVRKQAFLDVGGFDTERYRLPSIEDIELGYRLSDAGGRILLLADVQGTHLKEWRFVDFMRTEIFRRAIPWATLMLERGGITDDLNVSTGERLKAVLAGLLALSVVAAVPGLVPWWLPLVLLLAAGASNFAVVRLFNRRRGPLFALAGLLMHQFYYLYSSAAFVWAYLRFRLFKKR
jgi:glycosyltransferase involved in cell wall biosynthesis